MMRYKEEDRISWQELFDDPIFNVGALNLENFNIINRYNQLVYGIHNFLFKIIEPVLTPIRRIMPNFGGLDLSALVLIFGLHFIQDILVQIIMKFPS